MCTNVDPNANRCDAPSVLSVAEYKKKLSDGLGLTHIVKKDIKRQQSFLAIDKAEVEHSRSHTAGSSLSLLSDKSLPERIQKRTTVL